ncbi:SDR family oxidoreductase [Mycolicibacter arupensis]|jgi:NAD(P)-dependent dehydrogenase (short-subunit alcohol dehydrogenase family)|uniref:SDR family oxidoreductase n=1 Tax=Mycolicibacter arupensis TaxID=342002 RepID=A0A5C7XMZ0_9MYCO|nr:SDR family oxidoreductase [Mycolicibacter arupensis]MCV7275989.1 SDR family oxidoreductase [Mycolicibacter arupensis]TXI50728.1 MAG: SDR family oxidoreductase [Mycolicibacter arupensis]
MWGEVHALDHYDHARESAVRELVVAQPCRTSSSQGLHLEPAGAAYCNNSARASDVPAQGNLSRKRIRLIHAQPVAVISGASQGIGAGLVTGYRKLGYAVVANSRNISPSADPLVFAIPGDIGQPGVGQRVVDAALERFGRVDTVVNNAGIFIAKPFIEYTDADYDAVTGVNLRGFFELSRAAVSAMLARGEGGHLVTISTSLVDHPNSAVPSALASLTKGGLNAATRALAVEYAGSGIRSNAVALGIIRTPMHDPASLGALAAMHPLGRLGEVDEVVDAVLYLEGAHFVTGEILHVDGGQSAGH